MFFVIIVRQEEGEEDDDEEGLVVKKQRQKQERFITMIKKIQKVKRGGRLENKHQTSAPCFFAV